MKIVKAQILRNTGYFTPKVWLLRVWTDNDELALQCGHDSIADGKQHVKRLERQTGSKLYLEVQA